MGGEIFLIVLAFIWIGFATIQDLKTREVANWLSYSLIIFALGFRFFYSLFSAAGFNFFYQGLVGFGIFFVLGNLLYYGRMFAGGDAKLMIALGTVLPFAESFYSNLKFFAWFLFLFFFIGAVYGLVFSSILALRNFKKFSKEFSFQLTKNKKFVLLISVFALIITGLGFVEVIFIFSGILLLIFPYLYLFGKALEKTHMIKKVKVNDLREGDWLNSDVKIGNKVIRASWEGLSKEDIRKIKKKFKEVKIKQGIPFVPVFFISFLVLMILKFRSFL